MTTRERIARHEFDVAPLWLVIPLAFLGACFLVWTPMGWVDWPVYLASAAAAVATGIVIRWRYAVSVTDQSESGVTVRYTRRSDG